MKDKIGGQSIENCGKLLKPVRLFSQQRANFALQRRPKRLTITYHCPVARLILGDSNIVHSRRLLLLMLKMHKTDAKAVATGQSKMCSKLPLTQTD